MRLLFRSPCIGKCGRLVLHKLGDECRKCRRARIHAGARRLHKISRSKTSQKRFEKNLARQAKAKAARAQERMHQYAHL